MYIPYIGITDFTHYDQVKRMLAVFNAHIEAGAKRQLHVGVMMNYKTLHGLETNWSRVFPANYQVSEIFASGQTYNCLHYVDRHRDPSLSESLNLAVHFGGRGLDALQLDMVWPEPDEIRKTILSVHQPMEIILQIGREAFAEAGNNPMALIRRLRPYDGVIHRVLLDKSMGQGYSLNAFEMLPFAQAIRENFPMLGIGVAGGLGPYSLHLVEPLLKYFSDLSIDAHYRLRASLIIVDLIDWNLAAEYIRKAMKMFN